MLNSNSEFLTIEEFGNRNYDSDRMFFIRPDKDLKEFAGEVISFSDFSSWKDRIKDTVEDFLSCQIVVSEPVGISDEWRLFVVGGSVATGSHYRSYGRLDVRSEVPEEVISFGEAMAKRWRPAEVFALDIAKSGGNLYVVEANCFNSSGFYAADIKTLIERISNL